ncbi:hypothetical protein FB451DRAFT_1275254 [Mycena latifolia]|nr:hypothetical protein FB451DRAFT_1275254 [Mycena latifolia]
MCRQAIRAFTDFRPLNRFGLYAGSISAVPAFDWTRTYSSSSLVKNIVKPSLPPPPEASTAPLVDSDVSQYLKPLYKYGWGFTSPDLGSRIYHPDLRRTFDFRSTKELVAFSQNTRNVPANITVSPHLSARFYLNSQEGITRSVIRLAIETGAEYQKICPDAAVRTDTFFHPKSLKAFAAAFSERKPRDHPPAPQNHAPIVSVALPSLPPAPALRPPSITQGDLETYIKPLVANGWYIESIPFKGLFTDNRAAKANFHLPGNPSLHRVYRFHDYASAKDFFIAVVAAIPEPTHGLAGVKVQLFKDRCTVHLVSFSKLSEGARPYKRKRFGISHTDVRFAIEVETEFIKNWAGRADNTAISSRRAPKTMQDVWKRRPLTTSAEEAGDPI